MHTASPGKPLSRLNHTIRCGNSLVSPDFYQSGQRQSQLFSEEEKEQINVFDWEEAFPEVFNNGGFDCVIGNPPYVKLQHFRRVHSDVAEYLKEARRADGSPVYESTQTGNFDMYLPFIEKGVELLNPEGRMGYIAPNVWLKNKYGRGLRSKMAKTHRLDRWIDFKSHQVFNEAITYTALQFFRGSPVESVRCIFAPDGDVSRVDWDEPEAAIPYEDLPEDDAWNLMPDAERELVRKLSKRFQHLGDEEWSRQVFQGLITSADYVYHLDRIGPGKYRTKNGEEVAIEDDIMHPLVSGPHAKRYQAPRTDTWILFPYDLSGESVNLFAPDVMLKKFPRAWAYLKTHEPALRARESGKFDDEKWYRFGRSQNIDKQELPKVCVAQTVPHLRMFYDEAGDFFINNVRVNGILPPRREDGWFLLGILNASVADFVFQRIAKPKGGGYYEANKQFIEPLPIPNASEDEKDDVEELAKTLQELHTDRRDLVNQFQRRLNSAQMSDDKRKKTWLWADIGTTTEWKKSDEAPDDLSGRELTSWAKEMVADRLSAHYEELDARLHPGAVISVENTEHVVQLKIDDREVLKVFDEPDTALVAAQWRHIVRDINFTEQFTAKKLVRELLKLRKTDHEGLRDRLVALDAEIEELDAKIADAEDEMNAYVCNLYDLTEEEIQLVEEETSHRSY